MADDNIFDPKKIIEKLRAQGIADKEIAKMFGELPPPKKDVPNSERAKKLQRENAWKYKNKHQRDIREEDLDPDYEPIEELRQPKPKTPKPRITRKKKKKVKRPTRNDWSAAAEERLKTLFEAGYSTAEIAKDFGTTVDAITGKIARLRKSGWTGMVGTTHNPLPSPAPNKTKKDSKLNPLLRRELSVILETNFGLVGKYFSKKWGLSETGKSTGTPATSATKGDLAASIIQGNQAIVSSLIRLDMSLRRGTSALTKAMSLSTARMTDAIANTVELLKKQGVIEQTTGQQQQAIGSTKGSGGSGALGILGAVLGGTLLSTLFGGDAQASVNPLDGVGDSPFPTENELRDHGEDLKEEEPPKEVEVKVKELVFDAQDIEFDADNFKFISRSGQESKFGPQQTNKASPSGSKSGSDGGSSGGGGFWNRMFGGGETFPDGGGVGAATGAPGSGGGGGSPIPSDADMAAKDKKWFGGGNSKSSGAAPGSFEDRFSGINDLSANDLSRDKFDEMFKGTGMEGKYDKVVAEAKKNNVSPSLMAGVIAHETGKGTSNMFRTKNNPAGLMDPATGMSTGQSFESVDAGIEAAGKTIGKNWRAGGQTIEGMGRRYAPVGAANDPGGLNSAWPSGVSGYIKKMQAPVTTQSTLTADQLRKAGVGRISQEALGGKVFDNGSEGSGASAASMQPTRSPTSGADLTGAQKEQDTQSFEERWNSRVAPEKRSDASDPGSSSNDTMQTTLLETEGPNHFHDFPMSDQGVGA